MDSEGHEGAIAKSGEAKRKRIKLLSEAIAFYCSLGHEINLYDNIMLKRLNCLNQMEPQSDGIH